MKDLDWSCIIAVIYLVLFWSWVITLLSGCTQIIGPEKTTTYYQDRTVITEKTGKLNTFLKSIDFDSLQYDPNTGALGVGKYSGIPAEVDIEFDPITRTLRFKTKPGKGRGVSK